LNVRKQFDIKPIVKSTMRVNLHDPLGIGRASANPYGRALTDAGFVAKNMNPLVTGQGRQSRRAIQDDPNVGITVDMQERIFNRLCQKHFISGRDNQG
jgi:hypothetical protein